MLYWLIVTIQATTVSAFVANLDQCAKVSF